MMIDSNIIQDGELFEINSLLFEYLNSSHEDRVSFLNELFPNASRSFACDSAFSYHLFTRRDQVWIESFKEVIADGGKFDPIRDFYGCLIGCESSINSFSRRYQTLVDSLGKKGKRSGDLYFLLRMMLINGDPDKISTMVLKDFDSEYDHVDLDALISSLKLLNGKGWDGLLDILKNTKVRKWRDLHRHAAFLLSLNNLGVSEYEHLFSTSCSKSTFWSDNIARSMLYSVAINSGSLNRAIELLMSEKKAARLKKRSLYRISAVNLLWLLNGDILVGGNDEFCSAGNALLESFDYSGDPIVGEDLSGVIDTSAEKIFYTNVLRRDLENEDLGQGSDGHI